MNIGRTANPANPGVAFVFVIAAALLVSSVGVTYWVGFRAVASNRKVASLRSITVHLDEFLSTMKDAETGQRGYLLSGKDVYLEPYHAAVAATGAELDALAELAAHGDLPEAAVAQVRALAGQKLAELEQTIKDRRKGDREAAVATVLSDRGMQTMKQLRVLIGDMRNEKQAEIARAGQQAESAIVTRTVVFILTALLNLAFLAWAYRRIVEEIRLREAAMTETDREKESLRNSEERFRLLFQQAAVGLKRMDPGGRLLEVNDRLCDVLGYSREELLQMSLPDFTDADDLPRELELLTKLLAGEIPYFNLEKRCLRKDGKVIWVRITGSLPSGDRGPALWWIAVVEEITQRKQAEEALRQMTDELARSNQDLEQFAYVASHDLQEPLRMVAGYLQLLAERYRGKLDEKADKFIDYAVDGAERMSVLIRDLLAYSRVNRGGQKFQKTSADEALAFALKNLASAIEESSAAIHSDPLPAIQADAVQLRQLFQNLIGNALKFRSPERTAEVRVAARRDGRYWLFTIQDNGIGFDGRYHDKMFMIFQRLQGRGKFPGTGIGLALCKRIVERHGGKIWATSQPGQGSTFHFTIPDEVAP